MKDIEIKELMKESVFQPSNDFTNKLLEEIQLAEKLKKKRRKFIFEITGISILLFVISIFIKYSKVTFYNKTIELNAELFPVFIAIIILGIAIYISTTQQYFKKHI